MLSPLELENKRILTSKRKYDRLEMDEYLDMVFENYKALFNEYEEQKKQIKTLSEGIQYYRSIESTMQKALLLAEKTSKETKDAAILKAEAIEKDANNKATQIIDTAEAEYTRIREKCLALVQQFNQYKAQLQLAANEQLRLITSATFEVETPEIADSDSGQGQVQPPMMTEMPANDTSMEPVQTPEALQESEEAVKPKSSVYSFSSTGNTQPLPDLSAALVSGGNIASAPEPAMAVQPSMEIPQPVTAPMPEAESIQPVVEPMTEAEIPSVQVDQMTASAPEEVDITTQFEMYTEAPQAEPALQTQIPQPTPAPQMAIAEPVPDKTMVLPDVQMLDREAIRGGKQPLTAAEQQSILEAETINLGDSIRAVRDQEQEMEMLEVPPVQAREEQPVIQLEPAAPEVQMQPQGLDSILQNITIGKKKTNGESAEDPFEFLGSVDDF